MIHFKKYGKTPQFRDVVRSVRKQANFKGLDEGGDAIYEESKKPIITFTGTVKLHGSNALVSYDGKELKAGKRSSFISEDDLRQHFGFSNFVYNEHRDFFERMMKDLHKSFCLHGEQITLYGEFSGKGIQKNVGISEYPKSFYFFALRVYDPVIDESEWIDISNLYRGVEEERVYNIYDFPVFSVDVDFEKPEFAVEEFTKLTEQVEKECPVTKQLGTGNTIGEGIVWTGWYKDQKLIFKVKGNLHAGKSKAKQLKPVDNEKLQKINEIAYKLTPIWRLNQKLVDVFKLNEGGFLDRKYIGKYIKSVIKDIIEEEILIIKKSEIELKELSKPISIICKNYFFEQEGEV